MEKETKKTILEMIFRLACVYLAATFFFTGWSNWQNEEYLKAAGYFLFSFSQVGQILGWYGHESKIVRVLIWTVLVVASIILIMSRFS